MISLHRLTRQELSQLLTGWAMSAAHARGLWAELYRCGVESFDDMSLIPAGVVERLRAEARLTSVRVERRAVADNRLARKYLLALADQQKIETVLMRYQERNTVCVSSQAGCALGCVFCATGQAGFRRDLTADEIVAQVLFAQRELLRWPFESESGREWPALSPGDAPDSMCTAAHRARTLSLPANRVRNVVLMGMGEPLLNYDEVMRACDILHDPGGLAIGAKQITLSTVGVIPGIVRLADERRPYSLAVSLHGATQSDRAAIVPTARAWPLDELIAACRHYANKLERRIFFEWTLIAGVNDSVAQARDLGHLLRDLPSHVNLIPLNATSGYGGASSDFDSVRSFQATLQACGIPSTVRQRRGIDIAAGCGQLVY